MKLKEYPLSIFHSGRLLLYTKNLWSQTPEDTPNLVVSLTSFEPRLKALHLVVRNMLEQDLAPKKIVLWLNKTLENKVPHSLNKMIGPRFEIRFSDIDGPQLKLIESLKSFPNDLIVTCDDDLIYPKNWLSTLYSAHISHPGHIMAHHCRLIKRNELGELLPYTQWNWDRSKPYDEADLLAIGSSGVLYPPHSFNHQVVDMELFQKLCPKSDDLWFKAMALLNDTPIKWSGYSFEPIPILGSQKVSLKKSNVHQDKNRIQWNQILTHFPELI